MERAAWPLRARASQVPSAAAPSVQLKTYFETAADLTSAVVITPSLKSLSSYNHHGGHRSRAQQYPESATPAETSSGRRRQLQRYSRAPHPTSWGQESTPSRCIPTLWHPACVIISRDRQLAALRVWFVCSKVADFGSPARGSHLPASHLHATCRLSNRRLPASGLDWSHTPHRLGQRSVDRLPCPWPIARPPALPESVACSTGQRLQSRLTPSLGGVEFAQGCQSRGAVHNINSVTTSSCWPL